MSDNKLQNLQPVQQTAAKLAGTVGNQGRGLPTDRVLLPMWAACLALALAGCNAQRANAEQAQPSTAAASAPKAKKSHTLTIYGYNYTNRYIDQMYVDGQGGGNLDVSTEDAGGGKGVCCYGWRDGTPLPQTFKVRWVSGGCMFTTKPNMYGERYETVRHEFSEREVIFNGPVPPDPGYLEVHIYPDEHIEIALTELGSPPRLKLDPARETNPYPTRCPDR